MNETMTKPPITLDEVVLAYKQTGLTPITGSFIDRECNGGCALTAIICYKNKFTLEEFACEWDKRSATEDALNEFVGIDGDEFNLTNFYDGFDRNGCSSLTEEYKVGLSIRENLVQLGMLAK